MPEGVDPQLAETAAFAESSDAPSVHGQGVVDDDLLPVDTLLVSPQPIDGDLGASLERGPDTRPVHRDGGRDLPPVLPDPPRDLEDRTDLLGHQIPKRIVTGPGRPAAPAW